MDENQQPSVGAGSCQRLRDAMLAEFGTAVEVDELLPQQDTFGWRFRSKHRLLFTVSTNGSCLPKDVLNLQVTIIDLSLENGDVVFWPEDVSLDRVISLCRELLEDERSRGEGAQ